MSLFVKKKKKKRRVKGAIGICLVGEKYYFIKKYSKKKKIKKKNERAADGINFIRWRVD